MLTTGQQQEVRERITEMEADAGLLFMRAENLRIHLDSDFLVPVYRKLAELIEALRQLKTCVVMSGEEPNLALERLQRLQRLKEGGDATSA